MYRRLPWGWVPGYAPICADANDPETQYQGLCGRLLRDTPAYDPLFLAKFKKFVESFVEEYVKAMILSHSDLEEYLQNNKSYSQARKQEIRDAFEALRGGRPTDKQCRTISSFIKTESYLTWKLARWINSRSDSFKAYAAQYLKPIEDLVFKMHWFIKHVPMPERPGLIMDLKRAGRRYFATDFTAFECHFKRQIMQSCEAILYRTCLRHTTEGDFIVGVLAGKNEVDLNNHLRTRLGTRCKLQARRMSGDLITSLGNGFTNLMLALFHAQESCGTWHNHIHGYVEGDDGIFATDFEMTAAFYARLGFTIKVEEVNSPNEASFCGLVFADGAIIRDPRSFFMSFGWTASFPNAGERIMNELLRAKALSCMYETPNCPLVSMVAWVALQKTQGYAARFVSDGYHEAIDPSMLKLQKPQPTLETRMLFADMYDIPVAQQLMIETLIESGRLEEVAKYVPAPTPSAVFSEIYCVVGT